MMCLFCSFEAIRSIRQVPLNCEYDKLFMYAQALIAKSMESTVLTISDLFARLLLSFSCQFANFEKSLGSKRFCNSTGHSLQ